MTNLVEVNKVSQRFAGFTALDDVSLEIPEGSFTVLLGPSGSGKTTLLNIIGGFLAPSEGRVMIAGSDITDLPPARRPTATVFQDYALFPHMTVGANVAFGLRMRGEAPAERAEKARKTLQLVGLAEAFDRKPHQLSGGQRQRVALARSLAVEPKVLLLDEPLGALDLRLRRQMQDELKAIQKRVGTTFIHVTHDQEEAMSIADNVVLVNKGKIEDYGPPERVYLQPATLFAATFMGDSNILAGRVAAQSGSDLRIDTGLGALPVSGKADAGASVHVSVRPEKLRLGLATGQAGAVALGTGRVTELGFQGTHRRCRIRMDGDADTELLARVPLEVEIAVGDATGLHARTTDLVLLRD